MSWCRLIYRSSGLNFIKNVKKEKILLLFFIFLAGSQVMHDWSLQLKEGWSNHQTQWPVSPNLRLALLMELRDVVCWADDVVFVSWPQAPHWTAKGIQWTVECELWSILLCFETFSIQVILWGECFFMSLSAIFYKLG